MSLETVVLAAGDHDEELTARLAATTADIAGPAGATVVVVRVFTDEGYRDTREQLNVDPDSEVTPDDIAERSLAARDSAASLSELGVDVEIHGVVAEADTTGECLVAVAADRGADLVVVGGRGRSPTGKALFGSTVQEVLRTAPCPVTFVRES